jgi:hypothetical protein
MIHNVIYRDAENFVPVGRQSLISDDVVFLLIGLIVVRAVNLNDQFRFVAAKVSDVAAQRTLPAKLQTHETTTSKQFPQLLLAFRLSLAQFFQQLGLIFGHLPHSTTPTHLRQRIPFSP